MIIFVESMVFMASILPLKKWSTFEKAQMTNWIENHSARDVFHWLQVFHFRGSATGGERQHYDPRCFRRQAETFPALCVYEEEVWAVSLLVFTDTCEEEKEEEERLETLPQHPFPICPLLYPLLSLWALSLVFLHASERRKREYVFNECSPFLCPRGPFHLHKLSLVAVSRHLCECTFQQHCLWCAWTAHKRNYHPNSWICS